MKYLIFLLSTVLLFYITTPAIIHRETRTLRSLGEVTYVDSVQITNVVPTLNSTLHWVYFNTGISTTGSYGLWTVRTSFGGRYNGRRIWSRWVDCSYGAILYSIKIKWCGVWNDGGIMYPRYADWGANWEVSVLMEGTPFSVTRYHRIGIGRHGQIVRITRG